MFTLMFLQVLGLYPGCVVDYCNSPLPMATLIAGIGERERKRLSRRVLAYLQRGREDRVALRVGQKVLILQGVDEFATLQYHLTKGN